MENPPSASIHSKRSKQFAKKKSKGSGSGPSNPAGTHTQTLTTFATPSLDKKSLLQVAVRNSLTGGSFIDTKFYAFSRRHSTGVVDDPLPVYANSDILRAASRYFDGFFDAGFAESKLQPLRGMFPKDKNSSTEEYDYDSDSDLEDEPESEDHSPDDDEKGEISESKGAAHSSNGDTDDKVHGLGRVIMIPDIAFITWKAFIFYIVTDEITFAPLKSQTPKADDSGEKPKLAPLCSPKSIYRLADKCGFDELKKKAYDDIRSKLSSENIMAELYSTLTSRYEEIRDMEIAFACQAAQLPLVLAAVPQWISGVADGSLTHTSNTIAAFVQKAASPSSTSNQSNQVALTKCGGCSYAGYLDMQNIYRRCSRCNNAYIQRQY